MTVTTAGYSSRQANCLLLPCNNLSTIEVSLLVLATETLRKFFTSFTLTGASVPPGLTLRKRLQPHEQAWIGGRHGILPPPIILAVLLHKFNFCHVTYAVDYIHNTFSAHRASGWFSIYIDDSWTF